MLKHLRSTPKTVSAPTEDRDTMNLRTRVLTSLPGTGFPPRGLFISRLGGLIQPTKGGSPKTIASTRFAEGALNALFAAGQCGWNIYVVGNEDAVAHGRTSPEAFAKFDEELCAHLRSLGIPLKRHYASTVAPDGKGPQCNESVFRFPNTGCFYHAQQEDGIELRSSWILSSDVQELAAGWRAGIRCGRIGGVEREGGLVVECDREGGSVAEMVRGLVQVQKSLT